MFKIATLLTILTSSFAAANEWWNDSWTQKQQIILNPGQHIEGFSSDLSQKTVLIRLHEGNFNFAVAADQGSDLRFIADDGKTVLPHSIERYDALLYEALVWVKVPNLSSKKTTTINLYYGSSDASGKTESFDAYDDATRLQFDFLSQGEPFKDSTKHQNRSSNRGVTSNAGIIGSSVKLAGDPIVIPSSESLNWSDGQKLTVSFWIKPTQSHENAVILSRENAQAIFRVKLLADAPVVEVGNRAATTTSPAGKKIPINSWSHIAVVAQGEKITTYIDGVESSSINAKTPLLDSSILLGGVESATNGVLPYTGELDALTLADVDRSVDWIKFDAIAQGPSEVAQRVVSVQQSDEEGQGGHASEALEHVMLFGDIAKNMMFDGWIAVGVCLIMIVFGWSVAVRKFRYLNSIDQGTQSFVRLWSQISADKKLLRSIDEDPEVLLENLADEKDMAAIRKSPIFHVFSIGFKELKNRSEEELLFVTGLTERSINAIKASLDTGLAREQKKLGKGLIYLTISIAGGPYVGLLGTVVGVMITFAIIAKSGEVDVNSIAPGIASALLATVAGLVVAIPALFIYSYLNSRIKDTVIEMRVFIEEYVARIAELFPEKAIDPSPQSGRPSEVGKD